MIGISALLSFVLVMSLPPTGSDSPPATLVKPDRWGTAPLAKHDLYPTLAGMAKIQGDVTVIINIDKAGKISNTKALLGPSPIRAWAESIAMRLKLEVNPTDGEGPWLYFVTVQFRLPARTVTVVPTPQGEIPYELLKPVPRQRTAS
jgi:hypothetical protein